MTCRFLVSFQKPDISKRLYRSFINAVKGLGKVKSTNIEDGFLVEVEVKKTNSLEEFVLQNGGSFSSFDENGLVISLDPFLCFNFGYDIEPKSKEQYEDIDLLSGAKVTLYTDLLYHAYDIGMLG